MGTLANVAQIAQAPQTFGQFCDTYGLGLAVSLLIAWGILAFLFYVIRILLVNNSTMTKGISSKLDIIIGWGEHYPSSERDKYCEKMFVDIGNSLEDLQEEIREIKEQGTITKEKSKTLDERNKEILAKVLCLTEKLSELVGYVAAIKK
jgi:hypothetical protein